MREANDLHFIIIINPLTARVVGAPHMILQPVFSIFPSSPLPSGTCRTLGLCVSVREFAKSQRAVENREKWRKLVAKSSVVPNDLTVKG